MKGDPALQDWNKYCCFHQDHDHTINNYKQLKNEIERLIPRGKLWEYVKRKQGGRAPKNQEAKIEVQTIIGGLAT